MGIYTIAILAHSGAGKTMLGEAMLFRAGVLSKMGSIESGTTVLDWEAEEKEHQSSTQSALCSLVWNEHNIDVVDTPGSMNFLGSTASALRAVDGAILMASAEPGIQSETELLWDYLERNRTPRLLVINKLDREQSDFHARLNFLSGIFENRLIALQIPWGEGENYQGVVDLIEMAAFDYSAPGKPKKVDIPPDLLATAEDLHIKLVEAAAEGDDQLLEKYLETEELNEDEIRRGLETGTRLGTLVPVYCTAASSAIGVDRVLDGVVTLLPDADSRRAMRQEWEQPPEGYAAESAANPDFSALVFKTKVDHYAGKLSIVKMISGTLNAGDEIFNTTRNEQERPAHLFKLMGKEQVEVKQLTAGELGVLPKLAHTNSGDTLCSAKNKVEFAPIDLPAPVLTFSFELDAKGEEDKLSTALHRIVEEDPTLSFNHDVETGDFLISGMGQIHLDLVRERLKREFNITATFDRPHVPYRETIRSGAKAQGKYKKQTGGRGQYGDCWIELKPRGGEDALEFRNKVVGGAIPRNYIPAIEKGIQESMGKGVVAHYPVIGIEATVYDGSYHDVDSSEMAFKIAGSMAFKKAMEDARPILLEPILELEIVVHADYMGDVMGDINSRRGKVLGMDSRGRNQVVRAEIPMGEALSYAIELRAMTSGQGFFTQKFARYEEVPAPIADKIIKSRQDDAST